jgi:hypothetical protein
MHLFSKIFMTQWNTISQQMFKFVGKNWFVPGHLCPHAHYIYLGLLTDVDEFIP